MELGSSGTEDGSGADVQNGLRRFAIEVIRPEIELLGQRLERTVGEQLVLYLRGASNATEHDHEHSRVPTRGFITNYVHGAVPSEHKIDSNEDIESQPEVVRTVTQNSLPVQKEGTAMTVLSNRTDITPPTGCALCCSFHRGSPHKDHDEAHASRTCPAGMRRGIARFPSNILEQDKVASWYPHQMRHDGNMCHEQLSDEESSGSWQNQSKRQARRHRTYHAQQDVELAAEDDGSDAQSSLLHQGANFNAVRLSTSLNLVNDETGGLVDSSWFHYATCALVIANSVVVGCEMNYMAAHWTTTAPPVYHYIDDAFLLFFSIELVMRFCARGPHGFLRGDEWIGNLFDVAMVIVQLVDGVGFMGLPKRSPGQEPLLLLRNFRLLRLLSVARLLNHLTELRRLVLSMFMSAASVAWSFALLFFIVFMCGAYFTTVVTAYKVKHKDDGDDVLDLTEKYYGTLPKAMCTLFESISSGLSWREAVEPLYVAGGSLAYVCFFCFVALTVFVVLNVVQGVFVGTALDRAAADSKAVLMYQLREFFRKSDTTRTGMMSFGQFTRHVDSDSLRMYMEAIDLHQELATDLFQLLDVDDSDAIDEREFVHGCLRLRGNAKAYDLAQLQRDFRWTTRAHSTLLTEIKETLLTVQRSMKDAPSSQFWM
eukprot:TRINITY_DN69330_c0_g1_i1.p1 TRINITY_DN69330_c0_g1~~TRINITY_DN69330_c0_g1_i1.p1  ORF type:complete len:654 (+),score=109.38 TRINITY_DN69330_c0_g1_i1:123-2084(+)